MRGKSKADGSQSPEIPERVGRYEILLPIASGGMATVYLGRSRGAGGFAREVAVKLTHAHLRDHEHFAKDVLEEAKLAGRIRHRNVVPVLDAGDDARGVFLVMEYVEGDSLAGVMKRGKRSGRPLPHGVGLRVLLDALAGLHAAHELCDEDGTHLGLVHRDFSPQNILVGLDGVTQLTDFGVAKAANRVGHTVSGMVKGKVAYMAPEHARGHPLDRRADVWSAGVVAWELLAGRRLYSTKGDVSTLLRIVTESPPRLRDVFPGIAPSLDHVVAKALAMGLGDRWPTAKSFAVALKEAAEGEGLLAGEDEVATYVQEVAGERLRQRRKSVANVRELRSTLDNITHVAHGAQSTSGTSSLLAVPAMAGEGADSLAEGTPAGSVSGAFQPPSIGQLGRASMPHGSSLGLLPAQTVDPDDLPTLRPPLRRDSHSDREENLGPTPIDAHDGLDAFAESTKTDTTSATPSRPLRSRGTRTQWVVLGVGAITAAAGLIGVICTTSPQHAQPPAFSLATISSSARAAPWAVRSAPSPGPVLSEPSGSPASSPPKESSPNTLFLAADAPIRSLMVGTREIRVAAGETSREILLTNEEVGRDTRVTVVAIDGRRAVETVRAGAVRVEVRFPRPSRPPVKGTGAPVKGNQPPVVLPGNPYGPKH